MFDQFTFLPGGGYRVSGVVRAQAVKIGGHFSYGPQVRLDYVGDRALVSFERDSQTVVIASAEVDSGAAGLRQSGDVIELFGVRCGIPVVVCLREAEKPEQRVRFVFQ